MKEKINVYFGRKGYGKTFYELEKENKKLKQRIKEHIKRENKLIIKLIEKERETNGKENY